MAKQQKSRYLTLEQILIPSQRIKRAPNKSFKFVPSTVVSAKDATGVPVGSSHKPLMDLELADYQKVESVKLYVARVGDDIDRGERCSATLSKRNYEELLRRYQSVDMVGKIVTVVYDNNEFAGFIGLYTNEDKIRKAEIRNVVSQVANSRS